MVPAVQEPFGRTLVEAMLVGTPIVAARSGGNVEALRDGEMGLLVEPDNAAALAEACLSLVTDSNETAARTAKAQADAQTRFGLDRHMEQVCAVYRELAAR